MEDEGRKGTGVLRPEDVATIISPLGPASATMRAAPVTGERIGKYIVERTLGRGGMGVVVAARHEQLDEKVAIKLLHPKAAKDAVQRERFVREARSIVRIKSEHVVRVLDAGVEEGTGAPFIVMEHLEGLDLGQVLSHNGPMSVPMAADCIIQICEAVAAAHALGIIHRDLKPSNFFLTRRADGTPLVKVLDFGISKAAAEEGLPDPRLTETQAVFGSPTYMSPEQIRSSKNVDARSDVWSLGVALFELLTHKLPFVADNVAGLLASVIADAPFRVATFVPNVPPELEAIVLACLEKDPARRIGSALELAARLAPFASADGAQLAARMDRLARGAGSTQSFPPPPLSGPNLHTPSIPPMGASRPPPNLPSAPFPPVAFGTTDTDLSATGASALRPRRKAARAVGIVVAVLAAIALVVAGTVGVLNMSRDRAAAQASKPLESSAPPASPPPPETTATPVVAVTTAPLNTAVPIASASPTPGSKRGRGARPGRGSAAGPGAAGASATPSPAPAPSANLDSRF